jgi:hypothetical protein
MNALLCRPLSAELALICLAIGSLAHAAGAPTTRGSAPGPAGNAARDVAKEVREIPIDASKATRVYRIHTAPGYPAIVEFPEGFAGVPACGDCGPKGLYQIDVFNEQHYFAIKPRLYPGPQSDGSTITEDDFTTTVNVRLQSGLTLTVQMELSDKAKADARVVFTLPNRAKENDFIQSQLVLKQKELEEKFAARVEDSTTQNFLRALAQPHDCAKSGSRTRHDDIVVEVKELCRFGDSVYVLFAVENRGRALVDIGAVELKAGIGPDAELVDDVQKYLPQPQVEFRGTATGVVGFKASSKDARSYQLVISEAGGRGREVTLSGISF